MRALLRFVLPILSAFFVSMAACPVKADTFTFVTGAGATNGGLPVSAEADIITGRPVDIFRVTLTNLQAPTNVAQALSDFEFTLGNGATTAGATLFAPPVGGETTIRLSDGAFTRAIPVAAGWVLNIIDATTLQLIDVAPDHLLLGGPSNPPGNYSNADTSIRGNVFLLDRLTFLIMVPSVNSTTTFTSGEFSFPTPLPATLPLFATGLGALGLLGWRRKKTAAG